MSVTLLKIVLFLFLFLKNSNSLSIINFTINSINPLEFHKLPRFWTNTGFCPSGNIKNSTEITNSLLSNDVQRNIELIGALPNNGIQTIRIHWLLQLIDFIKFNNGTQQPQYNFKKLDKFIKRINKAKLSIGFEFMGNPGGVFSLYENVSKSFLWENLSYQIVQRYLNIFGGDTVTKWKFETWNEPDLKNYNLLKFNQSDYLAYVLSLRKGLSNASQILNGTNLKLYGPAGLFKKFNRHPLCWSILEFCNNNQQICPLDVLTFHRKGQGLAYDVFLGGQKLIKEITEKYPKLKKMKFANNEADPIAGWSTPRPFQADVRYAVDVLKIISQHWNGMINNNSEFSNFEYISHDNAFLSYWPYVFEQRTLLAHFQMNNSYPKYSQFIQKPVYVALGMISNLAEYANDAQILPNNNITILTTISNYKIPLYFAILLFSDTVNQKESININLPLKTIITNEERLSVIIEGLLTDITDPVKIWNYYGKPSYPNSTIRMAMRSVQGPIILQQNDLQLNSINKTFQINFNSPLKSPWIILLRICNFKISPPFKPYNLRIRNITNGEIMILWNEIYRNERCLMTYQIYFSKFTKDSWILISNDDHVPFLSYHFQPSDGITQGYYKVRGIDVFGRKGEFSKVKSFF